MTKIKTKLTLTQERFDEIIAAAEKRAYAAGLAAAANECDGQAKYEFSRHRQTGGFAAEMCAKLIRMLQPPAAPEPGGEKT